MSRSKNKAPQNKSPEKLYNGLPQPFPSSPSKPPRLGIYIITDRRTNYITFYSMYPATHFLHLLPKDFDWHKDDMVFEDFTLTTKGNSPWTLKEVYEHQLTPTEQAYTLPENFLACIPLNQRPQETPKTAQKRPETLGPVVTLQALASDASTARQALRKAGISKPGSRWEWPSDHKDLPAVQKLLQS